MDVIVANVVLAIRMFDACDFKKVLSLSLQRAIKIIIFGVLRCFDINVVVCVNVNGTGTDSGNVTVIVGVDVNAAC